MPTLADIYSAINTAKRKGTDFIQNPGTSLAQMLGNANDRARAFNELNRQAAEETIAARDPFANGPANQELLRTMSSAYNPAGITFLTGKPITFPFIKNTQKAPQLQKYGEDRFGQAIEPHGNYITSAHDVDVTKLPENYIHGSMEFKNPLVIDWGKSGLYTEPDNWKQVLSKQYGGKKGKALSKAIAKDGYDGIVTMKENEPSEIVDLSRFFTPK
jgi:hypothetical protein